MTIHVLFLCVHNAGRSQMAAGFLRSANRPDITVWSGGSAPGAAVNTAAITAMRELGIEISTQTPRKWTDTDVHQADVVITMGCGDSCPVVPGKRYEDWNLEDPAGKPIEVVRRVRDEIKRHVELLVASL
jgi:arsenate reductase